MAHYSTFVIRILVDDEGRGIRQGQITQTGTRETVYFRDLSKAMDFILRHLGDAPGAGGLPKAAAPRQPAVGELEDAGPA